MTTSVGLNVYPPGKSSPSHPPLHRNTPHTLRGYQIHGVNGSSIFGRRCKGAGDWQSEIVRKGNEVEMESRVFEFIFPHVCSLDLGLSLLIN